MWDKHINEASEGYEETNHNEKTSGRVLSDSELPLEEWTGGGR